MTDGAERLADATGLSKTEIVDIWNDVKANRKKLASCRAHRFEGGPIEKLGAKYTCSRCGGEETLTRISDYIEGFKAAGGNADDIWPGWR